MTASSSGEVSVGESDQSFSIERGADQGDVLPLASTACTRHQYVPFGTVVSGVARVFFVPRSGYTGELKSASAARTKLYFVGPAHRVPREDGKKGNGLHRPQRPNETAARSARPQQAQP